DPIIKARLVEQGGTVFSGSPADFEKLIADDTAKWAKGVRGANIKPEKSGGRPVRHSITTGEINPCRGIWDRCQGGRSAGMITVRRDVVRTQSRAPKGGGDQRDREAVGSSSRLEARFRSRRGCQM